MAGWAVTRWLGGRLVRGKLIERIPGEPTDDDLENILLLNHAPAGSRDVAKEMIAKADDAGAMEVNTAMLLWLTGRQDAEEIGEDHVATQEFIDRTSVLMRDIGMTGEQVSHLLRADLPQTVIHQQLSTAPAPNLRLVPDPTGQRVQV